MIHHDRGAGDLSASGLLRRSAKIATAARITRAIAATYSLAAGSLNREAGTLTKKMVATTTAAVIATLIQIFRQRILAATGLPRRERTDRDKVFVRVSE